MKKKGFTLIEIIVVIALVSVIGVGTSVAIIKSNNKKETDILLSNQKTFETALEIYLETHSEVLNNVNNKYEGAVITLETLKNEGLINSNLNIDYKENYYIVSNALLSDKTDLETNVVKEECNNSIEINMVASWAKSYDSSSVLYFCPKETSTPNTCTPNGDDEILNIVDPFKKDELNDGLSCENDSNKTTLKCTIINNAKNNTQNLIGDNNDNNKLMDNITNVSTGTVYREKPLSQPFINYSQSDINISNINEFKDKYVLTEPGNEIAGTTFETDDIPLSKFVNYTVHYGTSYKLLDNSVGSIRNLNKNTPIYITETKEIKITSSDNKIVFDSLEELEGNYVHFGTEPSITEDTLSLAFRRKNSLAESNVNRVKYEVNSYEYIYKITEVIQTKDNKNKDSVKFKYSLIFPDVNIAERTLSQINDDYTETTKEPSYYFRGAVEDNYINFANMCWRIVRIAGDSSIKLVLDDAQTKCNDDSYKGNFVYNSTTFNNISYSGQIGDRKNSKIDFMTGYNNKNEILSYNLKKFQDDLLNKNVGNGKKYTDYLKSGNWCYADINESTTRKRTFEEGIEEITCDFVNKRTKYPDNTGIYVGTLLAEEIALAGASEKTNLNYYLMNHFTKSWYYIDKNDTVAGVKGAGWLTMSPGAYGTFDNKIYGVSMHGTLELLNPTYEVGSGFHYYTDAQRNYRPAINLIAGIKISKGNGTRSEPYEIDFS